MRQLTLDIPEKEYAFFIQLLKKFDFIKIKEQDYVVPEEHKAIVRERIRTAKPGDYIDWEIAEKKLRT